MGAMLLVTIGEHSDRAHGALLRRSRRQRIHPLNNHELRPPKRLPGDRRRATIYDPRQVNIDWRRPLPRALPRRAGAGE